MRESAKSTSMGSVEVTVEAGAEVGAGPTELQEGAEARELQPEA